MRLIGLIIIICALGFKSNAQIYFQNPSFEADSPIAPCVCTPSGWTDCEVISGVLFYSYMFNGTISTHLYASDGLYYSGCQTLDSNLFLGSGQISLSQILPCHLKAGKPYVFSLDCAAWESDLPGDFNFHRFGILQVVGNNDTCTDTEILFESPPIDTFWTAINVLLVPQNNFSAIRFKVKQPYDDTHGIFIDNLSPIHCLNYNEVQSLTNDTAIWINGCVTLTAIPSGGYDSAYWKTTDGTVISNALVDVIVCPDVYTEYIVCTRSTDCGNFWSYDTVRVDVYNGIAATKPFEVAITPSVNCNGKDFQFNTNQKCMFQVFDLSGKQLHSFNFNSGKHNVSLNGLVDGVYLCRVQSERGVVTKRIVVNNCE